MPNPDNKRPTPAFTLSRLPFVGHLFSNPALRDRDFHKLCVGTTFNNMGMSGETVIMGILVFQITQSSTWVGIAIALYNVPMLIFGLASGVIADWMDRRTLLRRIELATVASSLIFAALILTVPDTLWLVILYAVISGCIRDSAYAARMSYAYDLVGGANVIAGLSLLNLASRTGQLIGALVAGTMVHRHGAPAAIGVLAVAHAIGYLFLLGLRSAGSVKAEERVPMTQNLRECFHEILSNKALLMLMIITAMVEVFGFSFSTTLPELASKRFGTGAEGLGQMHATRALGGIIAALALATFVGARGRGSIYLCVICAFGSSLILLSAADQFIFALGVLALVAALASASDVLTQSMMQLSVPDALRGRAMGFWVFSIGWAPIGHLEIGFLSDALGVETALLIHGSVLIAIGLIAAIMVPRLRKL